MNLAQQAETPCETPDRSRLEFAGRIGAEMPVGISSFGSWMLGVGTMIGSMAWLIYAPMLARAGALPTISAWTFAALITLPLAFILAELSSMFPSAGGPYVYKYIALKRLLPRYGELLGFGTGWLYWIAMIAGVACMANGFASLVTSTIWTNPGAAPPWFDSLAIVLLLFGTTVLNLRQISKASQLNNLFTLLKMALAFAFVTLVLSAKSSSLAYIAVPAYTNGSTFIANVMKVLVLSITAFAGIELVGCTSSETVDARQSIPRAIIFTLLTVALIYVGLCLSICAAAPYVLSGDQKSLTIPGTMFQATCPAVATFIGGPIWGRIFTAGVIGSIISCTFNALLALSRISYSMSETKLFPAKFSQLDEQNSIPREALWFQFWCVSAISVGANIVAHVIPNFDPYTFLGEVFGFLYSFLAILYGVCLISLRYTEPALARPFRIGKRGNGLAWFMTTATALVYGFIAFGCAEQSQKLVAIVLLLSGLPVYWFYRRPAVSHSSQPSSTRRF
jgi:APA family basic amino acid/polyamine antiporter